ncbi:hypothetical protein [Metallosphaera hakonensis]|uniref:Uncharacterized protein n=1 Tax=Metallosphaera hakonensis JCM 8857 = DSM 7519 TaxID=1293036 RepID=A0A2U9IQZ7_9CREN|nr:hypothetical protein [Metallosphaera hakonensis]AWR98461.1 hypothetical protein DFR87_00615 [Metallosphaera hakonensis JCM 8857 = DSM 7519]
MSLSSPSVYKVRLKVFGLYGKEIIPSTTLAGGVVHGMVLNKDKVDPKEMIMFSDFKLINYGRSSTSQKKHYVSRTSIHRVLNKTEPFFSKIIREKGLNFSRFEGYVVGEKSMIFEILSKYLYYVGNNFTVVELEGEPEGLTLGSETKMCLYNLVLSDEKDINHITGTNSTRVNIKILRFQNSNYMGQERPVYSYSFTEPQDSQDPCGGIPGRFIKLRDGKRLAYLISLECRKGSPGSFYWINKTLTIEDERDHYTKLYLIAGTGVIAPCL